MSLGTKIDMLYDLRQQRLDKQKEVDEMKKAERKLNDELMEEMKHLDLDKAAGTTASVGVLEKTVPHVTDWDQALDYIFETRNASLLYRRLNQASYAELKELGIEVPGTEPIVQRTLSLTRSKR
jgi:hypothetical protein